jgi:predicted membrane-bound spermidine synthase
MRRLALLLSFSVGFLSLSQEIIWVRLVSFAQGGRPQAFSLVLAAFLVGIAFGAIVGRRLCRNSQDLPRAAGMVLFIAGAVDLLMLQLAPLILPYAPLPLTLLVFAIALTAGLKGVLFPIVHHLGSQGASGQVGRSVSRIYLSNVMGSSLGPVVTGFWLLDHADVETAMALTGLLAVALGLPALAFSRRRPGIAWLAPAALLAFGAATVARPPAVVLPLADSWGQDKAQIRHVIQNKHGIIHVLKPPHGQGGDITFGGNAYDGRINVDLGINSNELDRAYLMAVMHPGPRRALVVGLSSGAWTRVIEGMPGIESVKVIEINPGYLDLIRRYPELASLLSSSPRKHRDRRRPALAARPSGGALRPVFPEHDLALACLHHPVAVGRLLARSEGPSPARRHPGQQCDRQHRRLPDRPRGVQARGPLQGLRLYERQSADQATGCGAGAAGKPDRRAAGIR